MFQLDARIPLGFTGGYDPAVAQRNQLMRLQRDALESEVGETNALRDVLRQYGPALNADDLTQRQAAAAAVAAVGPRGYALAAPVMTGIRNRRELDAIMGGGAAPAAPSGAVRAEPLAPVNIGGDSNQDGFTPQGLRILTGAESGGNPNARPIDPATGRPRSSALGPHQFIDGTWLAFARANPNLFPGVDVNTPEGRRLALSLRTDPERSAAATQWYAQQNARALRAAGVPVNDTTLALSHQFDGPVAARIVQVAQTQPNTPVEQVVGPAAVNANPEQLRGKTVGQVVEAFSRRQGGAAAASGGAAMPAAAPGAAPSGAPRMPGQPTPQQFAGLMQAAANGNEQAQRLVQMWAPFMRQETRQPPAPVRLGDGPAGPAGMYIPDASAPGGYRRIADAPVDAPATVGTIPPGYQLERTPEGAFRMTPIPGSAAERAERQAARAEAAQQTGTQRTGNVVLQDIDRTLSLLDSARLPVAGFGASTLSGVPGTAAADAARLLASIRANVGFEQLAQMRRESPTGAALGAVTERELQFLQAVLGSLDQEQSPAQFRQNLMRLRNVYLDIVHGPGQGPPRSQTGIEQPGAPPAGARPNDAAAVTGPGGRVIEPPPPAQGRPPLDSFFRTQGR